MYSKRAGLVLGFHGCDRSLRDKIVIQQEKLLKPSTNNYNWLGNGAYFWENNYERALHYAKDLKKFPQRTSSVVNEPAVLGAVIDLGYCLDLLDSEFLILLKDGYSLLETIHFSKKLPIPKNLPIKKEGDLLIRRLDCAVIETIHEFNRSTNRQAFDSVKGVFFEGDELYPNSGFKEKNHIQIAVRNPNCIKGYFIPRVINHTFPKP